GKLKQRYRLIRTHNPGITPVIAGDAVAILSMSDNCPLSSGSRVHFQRNLSVIAVESFIASFAHEAGQGCHAFGATQYLDIPVEDSIGGRSRRHPAVDLDF